METSGVAEGDPQIPRHRNQPGNRPVVVYPKSTENGESGNQPVVVYPQNTENDESDDENPHHVGEYIILFIEQLYKLIFKLNISYLYNNYNLCNLFNFSRCYQQICNHDRGNWICTGRKRL